MLRSGHGRLVGWGSSARAWARIGSGSRVSGAGVWSSLIRRLRGARRGGGAVGVTGGGGIAARWCAGTVCGRMARSTPIGSVVTGVVTPPGAVSESEVVVPGVRVGPSVSRGGVTLGVVCTVD